MSRIRDHERALTAHGHVQEIKALSAKDQRSYGAHCHKLAVLVHQAGLAAALHHTATLRGAKPRLNGHLAQQLRQADLLKDATQEALLSATREADLGRTWLLTREVSRCLEWYRRLAHGELGVSSSEDDGPTEAS
jgi:CRISPR/Cas system CMR-associated protein Cmr5 small subunit